MMCAFFKIYLIALIAFMQIEQKVEQSEKRDSGI